MEACEAKCTALGEGKCAAFSFCDGSNCKGSCALYPPPLKQYKPASRKRKLEPAAPPPKRAPRRAAAVAAKEALKVSAAP